MQKRIQHISDYGKVVKIVYEDREEKIYTREEWDALKAKEKRTGRIVALITILVFILAMVIAWAAAGDFTPTPSTAQSSSSSVNNSKDDFDHDKFDAFVVAKKVVEDKLKSPSTAKFCDTRDATISLSDNTWTVNGWVDAQNSFGATIRNTFTVKITFTNSNRYSVETCLIT